MAVAFAHQDRRHRITVEEFLRLCPPDGEYRKWELVDGEIWEPVAEGAQHSNIVESFRRAFARDGAEVRASGSVQLAGDGLVNPDVYVLRTAELEPGQQYWRSDQLVLAVEVALNTWSEDYNKKRFQYARAGVPGLYLVSPELEVHHFIKPLDGDYTVHVVLPLDEVLDR
jgi:Uma2 family endonuclease